MATLQCIVQNSRHDSKSKKVSRHDSKNNKDFIVAFSKKKELNSKNFRSIFQDQYSRQPVRKKNLQFLPKIKLEFDEQQGKTCLFFLTLKIHMTRYFFRTTFVFSKEEKTRNGLLLFSSKNHFKSFTVLFS